MPKDTKEIKSEEKTDFQVEDKEAQSLYIQLKSASLSGRQPKDKDVLDLVEKLKAHKDKTPDKSANKTSIAMMIAYDLVTLGDAAFVFYLAKTEVLENKDDRFHIYGLARDAIQIAARLNKNNFFDNVLGLVNRLEDLHNRDDLRSDLLKDAGRDLDPTRMDKIFNGIESKTTLSERVSPLDMSLFKNPQYIPGVLSTHVFSTKKSRNVQSLDSVFQDLYQYVDDFDVVDAFAASFKDDTMANEAIKYRRKFDRNPKDKIEKELAELAAEHKEIQQLMKQENRTETEALHLHLSRKLLSSRTSLPASLLPDIEYFLKHYAYFSYHVIKYLVRLNELCIEKKIDDATKQEALKKYIAYQQQYGYLPLTLRPHFTQIEDMLFRPYYYAEEFKKIFLFLGVRERDNFYVALTLLNKSSLNDLHQLPAVEQAENYMEQFQKEAEESLSAIQTTENAVLFPPGVQELVSEYLVGSRKIYLGCWTQKNNPTDAELRHLSSKSGRAALILKMNDGDYTTYGKKGNDWKATTFTPKSKNFDPAFGLLEPYLNNRCLDRDNPLLQDYTIAAFLNKIHDFTSSKNVAPEVQGLFSKSGLSIHDEKNVDPDPKQNKSSKNT